MMNGKSQYLPFMGIFTLALLLIMVPGYAGAQSGVGQFTSELVPNAPGQIFYGDGAVYDASGYLRASGSPLQGNCLACHSDKSSYLKTGHGNMLKKVSAGQIWKGATMEPHSLTNPYEHVIDWSQAATGGKGRVNLGGSCDVGGFEGQFDQATCEATTACTLAKDDFLSPAYTQTTCQAGGGTWKRGVWTPAPNGRWAEIIYFVGDWMGSAAGYVDTGIKIPERPNKFLMADGRQYGTCGSCHNTGYRASDYTRVQPYADYSNFARDTTSGALGSWVLDGIQCERCHNATDHPSYPGGNRATVPSYANSTALCSQCHIRPGAWEYVVIAPNDPPAGGPPNPNWATQPTAYPIGASATNFGTHLIGKQFLNSPHGLFTGSFAEIADTSKYGSGFSDGGTCSNPLYTTESTCEAGGGTWTPNQGGCATCHNVHESTVAAARENFGHEPMKNQCGINCHSSRGNLNRHRHPAGPGTPFNNENPTPTQAEFAESCVICHMPKPMGGEGLNVHVFRISTDPTYSTFPAVGATTPGICSNPSFATTKTACTDANTGGYCYDTTTNARLEGITTKTACTATANAAWKAYTWSLVANSAPEIIEGTEINPNAVWVDIDLACGQCHGAGGSAHQLAKGALAGFAAGMHTRNATPITCADCHPARTAVHPAGANTPTKCADCHGTTKAGVMPTVEAACITCHARNGSATHQFTADQIKPYADAIHGGGSAPSTTCTVCHTEMPETLITHQGGTDCTMCHNVQGAKPGVIPTSAQACNSCHGGSTGRAAYKKGPGPRLGASFKSKGALASGSKKIHKNVAPTGEFLLTANDRDLLTQGIQVYIDDTVTVTDLSTDQNQNISSIKVAWGDATYSYITQGERVTHSYATTGNKTVSISVIDMEGLKSKTVKKQISVVKTP